MYGHVGTLYYFGDNDRDGWKELFDRYRFPPYEIPKLKPEISFGMAGICFISSDHEEHKIIYI